jgi:predicted TPR repeat methyltransferase
MEMVDDSSRHNPWLAIPLEDYERHMSADSVVQAGMLAETLRRLVQAYRPGSFALLGSAGGNGLESLDPAMTRRVVAVDVNAAYLQECSARHAARFDRFEAVHCDLSQGPPFADPVELVYAALVVEYLELDAFLGYVSSLVTQKGRIAFVFQDRDEKDTPVSDSGVRSIQLLKGAHVPVDLVRVVDILQARGMVVEERRALASAPGKHFTLLVMVKR